MEVFAVSKSVRISPRKARLVAQSIRLLGVDQALAKLALINKRASYDLEKTLKSAIANALNNANLKRDTLFIKTIDVLEAPSVKRSRPSSRGRVHAYKKRGSHLKIILEDRKETNGTKS